MGDVQCVRACVFYEGEEENNSWKTTKKPIGWLEKKVFNKSVYIIYIPIPNLYIRRKWTRKKPQEKVAD